MSHSPLADEVTDDYRAGWRAIIRLIREQGKSWSGSERNCAFLNSRGPVFANISAASGLDFIDDGRGVAVVDWDLDGDLDVWLRNRTGPRLRLMLNRLEATEARADFVAFRLAGTTVNRDAIGARVEVRVAGADVPLIRTLRAGDGFVSQSSKLVHFGLGDGATIESVAVRWPGGAVERFDGVTANRHWRLAEGRGRAEPWGPGSRSIALAPADQVEAPRTRRARVVLPRRFPLGITLAPFDDPAPRRESLAGRPTLVNLWASWCSPCVGELQALGARKAELDAAGLRVLALSVDGLGEDEATTPADAERLIERLGFPHPAARATTELLDLLEIFKDYAFGRIPPQTVPTSLLFDRAGRLALIYRGPVEVDTLLADLARLDVPPARWREDALPFGGRWYAPPSPAYRDYAGLARQLAARHPADAAALLAGALEEQTALLGDGALSETLRRRVAADRVDTGLELGRLLETLGRPLEAVVQYQAVLREDPGNAAAGARLGQALSDAGRGDQAAAAFAKTLQLDPANAAAHNGLGALLASAGRFDDARRHFEQARASEPDNAEVHSNLGLLAFLEGDTTAALGHYRRAVELDPRSEQIQYNLGVALDTSGDPAAALARFRAALELAPDAIGPLVDAAWILATTPDTTLRDPGEAVRLAERAVELTARRDATALDTLAAAYAAAGRFDRARATGGAALDLAKAGGQTELIPFVERRLDLYRQGRPWVESD